MKLQMTGFKPWISDVRSHGSTNCATTTTQLPIAYNIPNDEFYCAPSPV